jgi:hypothetical protein
MVNKLPEKKIIIKYNSISGFHASASNLKDRHDNDGRPRDERCDAIPTDSGNLSIIAPTHSALGQAPGGSKCKAMDRRSSDLCDTFVRPATSFGGCFVWASYDAVHCTVALAISRSTHCSHPWRPSRTQLCQR